MENIAWTGALRSLTDLRCDRNRISSLPDCLTDLADLIVLDVSHNRLESIQFSMLNLISRLRRFNYFNLTLRPRHVRHDPSQLIAHLELDRFLSAFSASGERRVRDITVGIVGETHSGKRTLVAALKDDRGISRSAAESADAALLASVHKSESRLVALYKCDA